VNLSTLSLLHWGLGACLEATILVLALVRKLGQRLPVFVAYLVLLVTNELLMFGFYRMVGFKSRIFFYVFWSIQGLFLLFRALVVYEICRSILSPLDGVWRLAKPFLAMMGCILLAAMLISTRGTPLSLASLIPTGQRGLELIIVGLLIAGLAFCRYYRVQADNYLAWIALGLGFHSIIQSTDNTFLPWLGHFALWAALSHASFDIAMIMWVVALWNPLAAVRHSPVLLGQDEYDRLSPQVTAQLRELNTRLLGMWK
jgi:hypothetical protein